VAGDDEDEGDSTRDDDGDDDDEGAVVLAVFGFFTVDFARLIGAGALVVSRTCADASRP
jgi:hypothetical protein